MPSETEAPGFFGVLGEMGGIAAMLIPDVAFAVLDLGHDDRAAAFGKKQQRHRGADAWLAFGVPVSFPIVRERILFADQDLGAFAIPIVIADEATGRESAGTLEAVEIIVEARLAAAGGARVVIDGEVAGEPVDARGRVGRRLACGRQQTTWPFSTAASPDSSAAVEMASPPMPAQVMLPVPASPGT